MAAMKDSNPVPNTTIVCRKCGAEGTGKCSMPGCPLPDHSRATDIAFAREIDKHTVPSWWMIGWHSSSMPKDF